MSKLKLIRTKLLLATSNPGKFREMRGFLSDLDIDILSPEDTRVEAEVEETASSFEENARLKSLAWSLKTNHLVLAEDSGLEVKALRGQPGIYSARFSSPRPTDKKNIHKVLRLMTGIPWNRRQARFISCLALAQKGKILKETRGEVRGYISMRKKGNRGFGYDPIFFYPPLKKNFGELKPGEKNKISHRGRALRKMKVFLRSYIASSTKRRGEGG